MSRVIQRFLAIAVAGLALLAAPLPAGARDSAWPVYSNAEFGFSVRLPGAPEVQRESQPVNGVPTTQVTLYYDLGGDAGLLVSATRFEGGFTSAEAAVQSSADSIAGGAKGPMTSRIHFDVQGAPAELMVFNEKGDYYASAIVVVKGDVLYQLLALGHGAPPKETAEFQQSFTLLDTP